MKKIFFVISSRIYTPVFPVCHDDDDDDILFTGMVDQYKCFKSYFQSKPLLGILIITAQARFELPQNLTSRFCCN